MVAKQLIIDKLVEFANNQINTIVSSNPMFIFYKPFIARGLNKYIGKADKFLSFIEDTNGNIDIEGIIDEEVENLLVLQVQKFDGVEIGEGKLSLDIPGLNKKIVITSDDIKEFKKNLVENKK